MLRFQAIENRYVATSLENRQPSPIELLRAVVVPPRYLRAALVALSETRPRSATLPCLPQLSAYPGQYQPPQPQHCWLTIRVRVVNAVASAHGFPFAISAFRTWGQVLRRADINRVAAVRAAVRARRDIASRWNGVCHETPFGCSTLGAYPKRSRLTFPSSVAPPSPSTREGTWRRRSFGMRRLSSRERTSSTLTT